MARRAKEEKLRRRRRAFLYCRILSGKPVPTFPEILPVRWAKKESLDCFAALAMTMGMP